MVKPSLPFGENRYRRRRRHRRLRRRRRLTRPRCRLPRRRRRLPRRRCRRRRRRCRRRRRRCHLRVVVVATIVVSAIVVDIAVVTLLSSSLLFIQLACNFRSHFGPSPVVTRRRRFQLHIPSWIQLVSCHGRDVPISSHMPVRGIYRKAQTTILESTFA